MEVFTYILIGIILSIIIIWLINNVIPSSDDLIHPDTILLIEEPIYFELEPEISNALQLQLDSLAKTVEVKYRLPSNKQSSLINNTDETSIVDVTDTKSELQE
jgi:hypothetical protein